MKTYATLMANYAHLGNRWNGRGPAPNWLKALLVDGKTLDDFKVAS